MDAVEVVAHRLPFVLNRNALRETAEAFRTLNFVNFAVGIGIVSILRIRGFFLARTQLHFFFFPLGMYETICLKRMIKSRM
jgi:hypothetical protein